MVTLPNFPTSLVPGQQDSPLDLAAKSLGEGLKTIVKASALVGQPNVIGNNASLSSAADYKEAKSFRFNAGTLFDVHAPAYAVNANQATIQAKTINYQVFHNQVGCVNNFLRAQNVNVQEADCQYNYSTTEHFMAAPKMLAQAGKHYLYGDYMKIQAGQSNQRPVTGSEKDSNYGNLDMGAQGGVALKSNSKSISIDAKTEFNTLSRGSTRIRSSRKMAITSDEGMILNDKREISLNSNGYLMLSSTGITALNSEGAIYIDSGTVIMVGSGGFTRGAIDLDLLAVATQVGEQIADGVQGIVDTILQVPSSLLDYTEGFISGLPEQIQGTVESATTSLFGSFTPGNIQSFLDSATPDALVGNVFSGAVNSLLPGYGDALTQAVPGLLGLTSEINSYGQQAFQFDTYPTLTASFTPYTTVPVASDKPSVDLSGTAFFPFSTYKIDPPAPPETSEDQEDTNG